MLQREAGYIDARPITYQVNKKIPGDARPDHTNLGPSAHLRGMSGLPSIADIGQTLRHFWVVPRADLAAD
jgi:hypothetical protein